MYIDVILLIEKMNINAYTRFNSPFLKKYVVCLKCCMKHTCSRFYVSFNKQLPYILLLYPFSSFSRITVFHSIDPKVIHLYQKSPKNSKCIGSLPCFL